MAYRVDDGGGSFTASTPVPTWMYPPGANPAPVTPPSTLGVVGAPYAAPVTPPTEAIVPTQPRQPWAATPVAPTTAWTWPQARAPMAAAPSVVTFANAIANSVVNALRQQQAPSTPEPRSLFQRIFPPSTSTPTSTPTATGSPTPMAAGWSGGGGTYRPATAAPTAPASPYGFSPVPADYFRTSVEPMGTTPLYRNAYEAIAGNSNTFVPSTGISASSSGLGVAGAGAGNVPGVPAWMTSAMGAANPTAVGASATQAVMPSGSGGGAPAGVDPNWWEAFKREHNGQTPLEVYHGDDALEHALYDKAWGEQFYAQYKRPPSLYDWKASYPARQAGYYYGGGGGVGAAGAAGAAGLPLPYSAAFASAFGMTPDAYYTADRGGSDAAASDYQAIVYYWQQKAGWTPTQEDLARTLAGFGAWARAQRQPLTMALYRQYLDTVLSRPGTEPGTNIASLNMGEL